MGHCAPVSLIHNGRPRRIATCNAEKFDKKIEAAENPAKHTAIEVRQAGYLQRSGSASFYANSTGYRGGLTEKGLSAKGRD